ncbi:DUF1837 domain-containing protein [Telluria sp. Tellsp131]|uniref:HamA C-terminal domain-containing protein n=1 Tax=Massilia sp. CT11-108 TaxID=3393900 RepID=UPI0039A5AF08
MKSGIFGAQSVIEHPLSFGNARGYLVGFDLNDAGESSYRWSALMKCLLAAIHEFAFGFHEGTSTQNTETALKVVDAARSIYKISHFDRVREIYEKGDHIADDLEDKFLRRGEFGELILHLLLREFFNTIPLLSKIYFKDSLGHAVHGFDCVHIDPANKTLWLGESKLYLDPKKALKELITDVQSHFRADYMEAEFSLIAKKIRLFDNIPLIDEWKNIFASTTKLKDKFEKINIPLLCTYSCDLFEKHNDETSPEFKVEYEKKLVELKAYFDNAFSHPFADRLNIVVLLFPVPSKVELVKRLHRKLSLLQEVGD